MKAPITAAVLIALRTDPRTLRALAEASGVPFTTLGKLRRKDRCRLYADQLEQLAPVLGIVIKRDFR